MEQKQQQWRETVTGLHLFHQAVARQCHSTGCTPACLPYVKITIFHVFKRNFPEWLGDAVSYPLPRRILNINIGICLLDIA